MLAEKQTSGHWRIKDLLLNIVITIIHGEPDLIVRRLESSLNKQLSKQRARLSSEDKERRPRSRIERKNDQSSQIWLLDLLLVFTESQDYRPVKD